MRCAGDRGFISNSESPPTLCTQKKSFNQFLLEHGKVMLPACTRIVIPLSNGPATTYVSTHSYHNLPAMHAYGFFYAFFVWVVLFFTNDVDVDVGRNAMNCK